MKGIENDIWYWTKSVLGGWDYREAWMDFIVRWLS